MLLRSILKGGVGVGVAQSAKYLPCEPEDLSLTPGTYVEKIMCGGLCL